MVYLFWKDFVFRDWLVKFGDNFLIVIGGIEGIMGF